MVEISESIEEQIQYAFALYDKNRSGALSLADASDSGVSIDLLNAMLKDMDADDDQSITFEEFRAAYIKQLGKE